MLRCRRLLPEMVRVLSVRQELLCGHGRCFLQGHLQLVFGAAGLVGQVLFILYMADLADVAAEHGMSIHAYADDNQLYIHCQPEAAQSAVFGVQQCVSVEQWMAASRLRLNMDKTELMWMGIEYNVSKIPVCCRSLTLCSAQVVTSDAARLLGVLLTSDLSLDKHITAVCAKCFFQLQQLHSI